ncbi:MAG: ABC transporter ATP-binding protein [Anaerolineae bacterium]|nr:ABC transporter ATP-binding protein [Anaerolineae bacterium]
MHVERLTKYYGKTPAVHDLGFDIFRGEIFGYLGPNGAGKTTTIRLLLDLIRPTAGHAQILGMDVHRQSAAVHRQIGNLPGELGLWRSLTGWDVVEYLGGLRGDVPRAYAGELAERLALDMTRKVGDYSSGMKRKLGLLQALMHKPAVLILDEPTNGLDPLVQQTFQKMMQEVRDEGRTVFMSSHVLPEVEHICDRVGILRDGKLETIQRISELKSVRFRWMTLHLADVENHLAVQTAFARLPGVSDVKVENGGVRFRVTGELDAVIKTAAGYHVIDMEYVEPDLEDIFLEYYGEKKS